MRVTLSCTMDLTLFPFDTQSCAIHANCWSDNGAEVNMLPGNIDMALWSPNQEFHVEAGDIWRESIVYACCPTPWPEIYASLSLRRYPDFYIMNLILPTICVTYLGTLQFLIPPEGAAVDRMGVPSALLLTLIAITFLVSEDAPKSAEPTNLSRFNSGNIVFLTISMLETSFVLYLAKTPEKVHASVLRTMLNQLQDEKRGLHSVCLDIIAFSLVSKGWKAFHNVHLKHIVPEDALVSTCEIGILMDVLCRILYPTAYSVFIASVFVYS